MLPISHPLHHPFLTFLVYAARIAKELSVVKLRVLLVAISLDGSMTKSPWVWNQTITGQSQYEREE